MVKCSEAHCQVQPSTTMYNQEQLYIFWILNQIWIRSVPTVPTVPSSSFPTDEFGCDEAGFGRWNRIRGWPCGSTMTHHDSFSVRKESRHYSFFFRYTHTYIYTYTSCFFNDIVQVLYHCSFLEQSESIHNFAPALYFFGPLSLQKLPQTWSVDLISKGSALWSHSDSRQASVASLPPIDEAVGRRTLMKRPTS